MFQKQIKRMRDKLNEQKKRIHVLKEMELFVLDNSLRESTVGQLRGHTIEDKWKIYEEIKKVGYQHIIVASFSHMTRLGDTFCRQLAEKGEDFNKFYAFSDCVESIDKNGVADVKTIPIGLLKMKKFGIRNAIIEVDLAYGGIDYEKFTIGKICELCYQRMDWARENLSKDSHIFINLRDFSDAMTTNPERIFKLVNFLSSLPQKHRPFGITYEETGKYLPEEVAVWTAAVRKEMDYCDFKDGHLLVHVHEQWGLATSTQLNCIANGATGVWASLCEEGASLGHCSSSITIMNLIRLGNERVRRQYTCVKLREAARNVTKITTGNEPRPKQPVYGARALDMVLDMPNFTPDNKEFDMAEFFGVTPARRITTLASPNMVAYRLKNLFGKDPQFTEHRGLRMLEVMLEDLRANRKEEYMSKVGIAILFGRSGGKLTGTVADVVAQEEPKMVHAQELLAQIRRIWDKWNLKEEKQSNDQLDFYSFYNGFMAPYFGSYWCNKTKRALKAIDMDENGLVDWKEFALYLKWAIYEYPQTKDAETLLSVAFCKGLIPAMQHVVLGQK